MGKRGPKSKAEKAAIAAKAEAQAKETPKTEERDARSLDMGFQNEPGLDPEREAFYEEANAFNYREDEEAESVPEDTEATTEVEKLEEEPQIEEKEDEAESVPEVAETGEVEYKPEGKREEEKETKTVPLDALHEEREKRKSAQARAKEYQGELESTKAKLDDVLQDYKRLKDERGSTDEYLGEEQKIIEELKGEVRELNKRLDQTEQNTAETRQQATERETQTAIEKVDAELADSGFPGFRFLTNKVGDEINKLVKEDVDNQWLNSPDGWKKIYKEVVYPSVKGVFIETNKRETLDKKKELKQGASLISSPGKSNKPTEDKKKDDVWTYDDYLRDRLENSPA